jgi:sugar (pentulose or hexulose) kinase
VRTVKDLILGIDLGTTALKVAVFDFEGRIQADSNQEYELLTPYINWVEADVSIYFDALKKGLADIAAQGQRLTAIKAVGFSAQGETLFFLDENGIPLRNAIVWMDNRATEEADILRSTFGDELCYRKTGQVSFEPCWPASKILWVKRNEPEVFHKTKKILLIEDYLIFKMTGQYVTEGSLLTSTEYWDINTKKYWPEMLETLAITEKYLPEIKEPGEVVGPILPEVAQELGISPDAIICTGCLDQAAGAIGVGNIHEGVFSENIGAALSVCVPMKEITLDPNRVLPIHYFAIPDTYMLHTFTTGGMTLRWFRDVFCELEIGAAKLLDISSYDMLSKEASMVPPGAEGLLMLPHLNGSMPPDMNAKAKGVFYGFTLKHEKKHFIRSIMEAIGYILQRNIEALEDMGIKVKEIRSLGGGGRSAVWNQIKADITQKTLLITECKEAACLGAAILAGKAIGAFSSIEEACAQMVKIETIYEPNKEHAALYEKGFEQYKKLFNDLHSMFDTV